MTPLQRKALHEDTALTVKQACDKYGVTPHTVYKWRKRADFNDRSHAPKNPKRALSLPDQCFICETRVSTKLSVANLVKMLKPCIPHIGRGNVYELLVRMRLNRKEYLLTEKQKPKPKKFNSYEPGCLHVNIKYLPKVNKMRHYLFVAIDRDTRLVTIGIYPKSGIKEAVTFLRHCVDFFEFPINYVLTDNAAYFTDRLRHGRKRPSGKHLFDMACKEHSIQHGLKRAYHPQTYGMVERFNRRVSDVLKAIHFKSQRVLTETMHGYVNHYNRKQTQAALGGLTPLDHWSHVKRTGGERQGGTPDRGDPKHPSAIHVIMSGNAAPDLRMLEWDARARQEHSITTCHPQLSQKSEDSYTCYYTWRSDTEEVEAVYDFLGSYPDDVEISVKSCVLYDGVEEEEGKCLKKINISNLLVYYSVYMKNPSRRPPFDVGEEVRLTTFDSDITDPECLETTVAFLQESWYDAHIEREIMRFDPKLSRFGLTTCIAPGEEKLSHLVFHLFDLGELADHSFDYCNLIELFDEQDGWKVEISNLKYGESRSDENERRGRLLNTHRGKLLRIDGGHFTGEKSLNFLEKLGHFLSFCVGVRTMPMFLAGFESGEKYPIWQYSRAWICDIEKPINNWFYPPELLKDLKQLTSLFSGFMKSMDRPEWKDILTGAINDYIGAINATRSYDQIILTYVAFENMALKCWMCHKEQDDSEEARSTFEKKHGISSDRIIWMLAFVFGFDSVSTAMYSSLFREIVLKFPEGVDYLGGLTRIRSERRCDKEPKGIPKQQDAGKECKNTFDALAHVRNRRAHGRIFWIGDAEYNWPSYNEASHLGLWYLEMLILKICGYRGKYINRLLAKNGRYEEMIRYVPWRAG